MREESSHGSSKRHDAGRRPMELDVKPAELLALLPSMSTQEKKDLYKTLKRQLEEEQVLPPDEPEKMVRPSRRSGGYAHHSPQIKGKAAPAMPSTASSSSVAAPPTRQAARTSEEEKNEGVQAEALRECPGQKGAFAAV